MCIFIFDLSGLPYRIGSYVHNFLYLYLPTYGHYMAASPILLDILVQWSKTLLFTFPYIFWMAAEWKTHLERAKKSLLFLRGIIRILFRPILSQLNLFGQFKLPLFK